jgi:hypothetical protein
VLVEDFLLFIRQDRVLREGFAMAVAPVCTETKEPVPDWDRGTGGGFNERGYAAGSSTYHDPTR